MGADGEIFVGSEEINTVLDDEQWNALWEGMRAHNPALTLEGLKASLTGQGHSTIAAAFDAGSGRTVEPLSRIAGEFGWSEERQRWEVSDKSGRFMSKKVRFLVRENQQRWLDNAAERFSAHLGVQVSTHVYKQADPTAQAALQRRRSSVAVRPPQSSGALKPTGPLVSALPSVYNHNPGPRAVRDKPKPGVPLSVEAWLLFDNSEWVPAGRICFGRPVPSGRSTTSSTAESSRRCRGCSQSTPMLVGAGSTWAALRSRSRRWRRRPTPRRAIPGQPVLVLSGNEFDNTGRTAPFLPVLQALADELKKLNPDKTITVVGSSSLMWIHPDGRAVPFTLHIVTHLNNRTQTQRLTLSHDQLYEVTGRGPSDPWTQPWPYESPFGTNPPPPTLPQGSTAVPVARGAVAEKLPWPALTDSPLADADYWAATLMLTPQRYHQLRAQVDTSGLAHLSNVEKRAVVGLLAYLADKNTSDTQAAQNYQLARSLIRGAAAVAHARLPRPSGPAYRAVTLRGGKTAEEMIAGILAVPTAETFTLSSQPPDGAQVVVVVVEVPAELLRDLTPLNPANLGLDDDALLLMRQPMAVSRVVTDHNGHTVVRLGHARDTVLPKTEAMQNGNLLWLREQDRALNFAERAAAQRLQVPAGHVGLMVHGQNGLPTLDGRPVSAATLAWLLKQQGMADKPIFLAMGAGPATVAYAQELAELSGQRVRVGNATMWVNTMTGQTVVGEASVDVNGYLQVTRAGGLVELKPGGNGTAVPVPDTGTFDPAPAGGRWVRLA